MQCLFRKISRGYEYGAESKALCRSRILAKFGILYSTSTSVMPFSAMYPLTFPLKNRMVGEVRFRIVV